MIGRPPGDMTSPRTRGAEHPFKFHARDHIGITTITQLGGEFRIVEGISRGEDDRSHFDFLFYRGLLMIDCFSFTDLNTEMAF
jgi:hypothetical protein